MKLTYEVVMEVDDETQFRNQDWHKGWNYPSHIPLYEIIGQDIYEVLYDYFVEYDLEEDQGIRPANKKAVDCIAMGYNQFTFSVEMSINKYQYLHGPVCPCYNSNDRRAFDNVLPKGTSIEEMVRWSVENVLQAAIPDYGIEHIKVLSVEIKI